MINVFCYSIGISKPACTILFKSDAIDIAVGNSGVRGSITLPDTAIVAPHTTITVKPDIVVLGINRQSSG
jgi:hypothetical protein